MSTLDKQTTDITEGATVEAPGEKDLVAAAACESQQTAPALEARNLTLVWGNGQEVEVKGSKGTQTVVLQSAVLAVIIWTGNRDYGILNCDGDWPGGRG